MIITNDFYTTIQNGNILIIVLSAFAIVGLIIWFVYSIYDDAPVQGFTAWILILGVIVLSAWSIKEYHEAAYSVETTLKEAGYVILDGFPEEVGDAFTVEKDGRVQFCLVGNTFEGGNTVRIECKG